jgi:hypothetical protein
VYLFCGLDSVVVVEIRIQVLILLFGFIVASEAHM